MSLFVFFVVLFAALLHAIWNAVVKGGADTLLTTILVTTSQVSLTHADGLSELQRHRALGGNTNCHADGRYTVRDR